MEGTATTTSQQYIKLKETNAFTMQGIKSVYYKHWCNPDGKYKSSASYMACDQGCKNFNGNPEPYRKTYLLQTEHGLLEVSSHQFAGMLESSVNREGKSNPVGREWLVKTNGKGGKEIRYYINPSNQYTKELNEETQRQVAQNAEALSQPPPEKKDLEDLPF